MNRRGALFDGSRLYRQAREGADAVLMRLEGPSGEGQFCSVLIGGPVKVRSADHAQELVERQKTLVLKVSRSCSSFHCLPVLAQAIDEAYYGRRRDSALRFGPALKIAFAFCYAAMQGQSVDAVNASHARLYELVRACETLDQLLVATQVAVVAPPLSIEITSDAVCYNEHGRAVLACFAQAFAARGLGLRTASHAHRLIKPFASGLEAVRLAALGTQPATIPFFQGSIFEAVPADASVFWGGLLARLALSLAASDCRASAGEEALGPAILGSSGFLLGEGDNGEELQRALSEAFWQPAWHAKQPLFDYRHLIVRRPVCRITYAEDLFVVPTGACIDSLATFIDGCFFREQWVGDGTLPEECFRQLFSAPFEAVCIETLRELGFRVGPVTQDGIWKPSPDTAEDLVDLNVQGRAPPGEIDVLAVHSMGLKLVLECKVLAVPREPARLRNLQSKLSLIDSESFHTKLTRKIAWLEAPRPPGSPNFLGAVGIIVLDRQMPFLPDADATHHVVSSERLAATLRQLLDKDAVGSPP